MKIATEGTLSLASGKCIFRQVELFHVEEFRVVLWECCQVSALVDGVVDTHCIPGYYLADMGSHGGLDRGAQLSQGDWLYDSCAAGVPGCLADRKPATAAAGEYAALAGACFWL